MQSVLWLAFSVWAPGLTLSFPNFVVSGRQENSPLKRDVAVRDKTGRQQTGEKTKGGRVGTKESSCVTLAPLPCFCCVCLGLVGTLSPLGALLGDIGDFLHVVFHP